ncbi:MAG: DUF1566 domain-containing protein [Chloroflexi bacterium]|nr:DUF1566 domain-containing protein [Chloroflexota bacterium]
MINLGLRKKLVFLVCILLSLVLVGCSLGSVSEIPNDNQPIQAVESSSAQPVQISSGSSSGSQAAFGVVETGQEKCYDNSQQTACPQEGDTFYGQDANYQGLAMAYSDNGDGTVSDLNTGLMWQQAHNSERLRYYDAVNVCSSLSLGGYSDWRLPSIDELYSIIDFSGSAGVQPYLNTQYFEIELMDEAEVTGETHSAAMMGQTWTSTIYTGNLWDREEESAFFVNFLDGRIKAGGTTSPVSLFYRCVRGAEYGANAFQNNGDGTVSDNATGLTWQQADDGVVRNWQEALENCETLALAGYDDWRLPNAKELQSIVDYTRSDPALDTSIFSQTDLDGWFWSSTTHGDGVDNAAYVCFGECVSAQGVDVHGAGAQRSDPKTGDASQWASGRGGQQDEVRIYNYSRCVRSGNPGTFSGGEVESGSQAGQTNQPLGQNGGQGAGLNVDLATAAATLGVTEEALAAALGDPSQGQPDIRAAAEILGVSQEALETALGIPVGGP